MKKLLMLLLASFLVLAACGQDENKTDDKKESKSSYKESKKGDKSSNENNSKKPLTDEEKLKKNIKKQSVKVKDIDFVNNGDEINITIEVSSAMSKKSTVRVMKSQTADTLYALKKTNLNYTTANVYVSPPDEDQYTMTSRWTYDTVNELNEDSTYTLPDEMEEKADGFMLNSYFR